MFQWDYDDVGFVLDQQTLLDYYSAGSLLKQQSTDRHVAPLGHIIDFETRQPVFALSP